MIIQKLIIGILLLTLSGCSIDLSPNISNTPCDELPSFQHAQNVMEENKETISYIEKLSPTNSTWLEIDSSRCQGKGEIIISYGNEQQRREIINVIGDTFFGVPYLMRNV